MTFSLVLVAAVGLWAVLALSIPRRTGSLPPAARRSQKTDQTTPPGVL